MKNLQNYCLNPQKVNNLNEYAQKIILVLFINVYDMSDRLRDKYL